MVYHIAVGDSHVVYTRMTTSKVGISRLSRLRMARYGVTKCYDIDIVILYDGEKWTAYGAKMNMYMARQAAGYTLLVIIIGDIRIYHR